MLSSLLFLGVSAAESAAAAAAAASVPADSSDSLLGGCSACKRVAAMSPEQRVLFFKLFLGLLLASLLLGLLYRIRAKAKLLQKPLAGDVSRRTVELMKSGASKAAIDESVPPAELSTCECQWSFPGERHPTVEILSARNLQYLLDHSADFEGDWLMTRDVFEELLGPGVFNASAAHIQRAFDASQRQNQIAANDRFERSHSTHRSARSQRKIAPPPFSFSKLNDYMFTTFVSESERVVAHLHTLVKSGAEFDFQQLMLEYTFDSICKVAFGVSMETIGSKAPHPFCAAFDEAQMVVTERSMCASHVWKVKRAMKANAGKERAFLQNIRTIDSFVYGIIESRKKDLPEFEESGDLLSLFLLDAKSRGETLSDRFLRDIILSFMLAGRDTTATALTHMFHFLNERPDIEERCAAEVARVLRSSVQPTPLALERLHEVEITLMESIRLSAPGVADVKLSLKSCEFPSGEIIPAGTYMVYSARTQNRLPSRYAKLSDALQGWAADCEEFRPSRWSVKDSKTGKRSVLSLSTHEYSVFNFGPRLGEGKSMAVLEAKCLVAHLLQEFRFKVRPGYKVEQRLSPVFTMTHGLPSTVQLRKQ